jgi:hypothetical protein
LLSHDHASYQFAGTRIGTHNPNPLRRPNRIVSSLKARHDR